MTEPQALGGAARRRGKASPAGGPDTPAAEQAPAASVLAPAELEQARNTTHVTGPLTFSTIMVLGTYFLLWGVLYTGHILTISAAAEVTTLPWSISAAQQIIGSALALRLWMLKLRPIPRLTLTNLEIITPIAVCHTLSQVFTAIALGDDDFYYSAIFVMATQPLFTGRFSTIFLKQAFSHSVHSALVALVIAGGAAVLVEPPEYWGTVGHAIGFSLAASMRTILAKRSMGRDMGDNMSPANLYAAVTILSSAMFLPVWIIMEGSEIEDLWEAVCDMRGGWLIWSILFSGVFFHLYNELAFRCLGLVHPLTHTVGSTFKHVCFATICFIVYDSEDISLLVFGCFMATTGMLLYILVTVLEALLSRT